MILLDTNVVIDLRDRSSPFHSWAESVAANAVAGDGAAINAVILAELSVGQADPHFVERDVTGRGFALLDLPCSASVICARAYSKYRAARRRSGGSNAPSVPLPDFFVGAHASFAGWVLATRDTDRYRRYFPEVELITP